MKYPEFPRRFKKPIRWVLFTFIFVIFLLFVPKIYSLTANFGSIHSNKKGITEFPVTVDPLNRKIIEDEKVESILSSSSSPLQASVIKIEGALGSFFKWISTTISSIPFYQNLSYVGTNRIVTIQPGLRKEQVANAFAEALDWNNEQKKEFLVKNDGADLPLLEGSFSPGTYAVEIGMGPDEVQAIVNERFDQDVLSHYGTDTEKAVPLNVALTVASLIQRETIGTEDMRMVSGIIWNRIFNNMNLQLDATLQYAKASTQKTSVWWPNVLPQDKYIKSPYNTYLHAGLPPTPIANPSVAAVLAALNPIKTNCLFYFHDKNGDFHCSETYAEHVAALKKYYGQGK